MRRSLYFNIFLQEAFFTQNPIENKWFLNIYLTPLDETLPGTITKAQSGPWSNDNKEVLHTLNVSRSGS